MSNINNINAALFENFDHNEFNTSLQSENDRACGVIGAALLDEKLKSLFHKRLRSQRAELLSESGVLGSFGARIKTAQALAWISDGVAEDMQIITKIRNKFAHSFDRKLDFSNQSIMDLCKNIQSVQAYLEGAEAVPKVPSTSLSVEAIIAIQNVMKETCNTPRRKYELAIWFIFQYLSDLPAETAEYNGPDLNDECYALSARISGSVSGNGTVGHKAKSG